MEVSKTRTLHAHAFVGWALSDATIEVGMALLPLGVFLITPNIISPVSFTIQ